MSPLFFVVLRMFHQKRSSIFYPIIIPLTIHIRIIKIHRAILRIWVELYPKRITRSRLIMQQRTSIAKAQRLELLLAREFPITCHHNIFICPRYVSSTRKLWCYPCSPRNISGLVSCGITNPAAPGCPPPPYFLATALTSTSDLSAYNENAQPFAMNTNPPAI